MNLNNTYGFIHDDKGYNIIEDNDCIDKFLPYKPDIEPRLVRFLRTLHYYRTHGITTCIPVYMEFQIKKEDWDKIKYYLLKYNITIFNKR